jgi:hypothetical protein
MEKEPRMVILRNPIGQSSLWLAGSFDLKEEGLWARPTLHPGSQGPCQVGCDASSGFAAPYRRSIGSGLPGWGREFWLNLES